MEESEKVIEKLRSLGWDLINHSKSHESLFVAANKGLFDLHWWGDENLVEITKKGQKYFNGKPIIPNYVFQGYISSVEDFELIEKLLKINNE